MVEPDGSETGVDKPSIYTQHACVVELVDTRALGARAIVRGGSTPSAGTNKRGDKCLH